MKSAAITNRVRGYRASAGLSQSELAQRVGVSRQALAAIEAGRQVPSTVVSLSLARVLRCTVEELFTLARGPRVRASLVGTASVRRVVLGQVDGTWVAHPLASDDRPADGVLAQDRVVGNTAEVEPLRDLSECEHNVLVAGCAPLLGVLAGGRRRRGGTLGTWVRADSTRSLELLARGAVHVAGLHLADASAPGGHHDLVRERFPGRPMVIISLMRWRQGLAVRPGNPRAIQGVADTQRPDVRFVGRAVGSGARLLLERRLAEAGLTAEGQSGAVEASGHAEVARLVRLGVADTGVVFEGAAVREGLDFVPLAEERFDLVLPKARLEHDAVAEALDSLGRREFTAQADKMAGYDLANTGESQAVEAA